MRVLHFIGIPSSILAIVSIDFNTWQGWVIFIISTLYALSIAIIYGVKGWQTIRRENFDHKVRIGKYELKTKQRR